MILIKYSFFLGYFDRNIGKGIYALRQKGFEKSTCEGEKAILSLCHSWNDFFWKSYMCGVYILD